MTGIAHGFRFAALAAALIAAAIGLAGCEPSDRRPGLWLTGEDASGWPDDWSFTSDIPEIAIEVQTPYWIAHSVTIWSATLDGDLYVGASAPDTKNWPGWVDRNPDVRLEIDDTVYEARLVPVEDASEIARLQSAYAAKYQLPTGASAGTPTVRYWRVTQRPA